MSAASAATGTPLVQGDEVLTILPGTLPADELKRRLRRHRRRRRAETGSVVSRCAGGTFVDEAGSTRRSTWSGPAPPRQRVLPAADVDDGKVPYFSLAMLPGASRAAASPPTGSVAVVGLGPGDTDWMTPQSRRELAAATDLIGYGPYLDRVRAA